MQRFLAFEPAMISPFILPPPPAAQTAAAEVIAKVHDYMRLHPESELHRQGKMFGVLVYDVTSNDQSPIGNDQSYLAAFSAMLDGSYHHEGFVPPVYEAVQPPVGTSREESQRLQRLLFANYRFTNLQGETRNLLEIFANEKPILSPEEFFGKSPITKHQSPITNPPSGAGECCAPKLLHYALSHGMKPIALAEFWVGAPSRTEVRQEGTFYAPCSGRCKPILKWILGAESSRMLSTSSAPVDILYEDEWLMVVNKPAGLLSVPGKTDEPSVVDVLQRPALQPVHRLDQDTSGLLVLAKNPEIYKTLQAYFQRRDVFKRYEAILCPNQNSKIKNQKSQIISLPLLPNPYDRPRQMVNVEHGKPAITRYEVRELRPDGTVLVDFFPLTGRTHQLRVHAAHPDGLNAPILGDRLYGSTSANRLCLHAAEILFVHPVTQKEMHFCIPSSFSLTR
ncbi:MAG: RluA family pseudouridine synthase [Bacteroidales bacterium]|nr:RluA family pseudouridine synthase [Bacteroidales bacterium]MDY6406096.1 RluA family pseudouridine synthase [Bacteroidales bacterium]